MEDHKRSNADLGERRSWMTTPPNRFDHDQATVPVRPGPRPKTTQPTHEQPGPHQQLSDSAPRELQQELLRRVRTLPEVEVGWSAISGPYARGFHLKPHAAKGPAQAFQRGSEFGHLHPEHDGSLHLSLPPDLYQEVLRAGWGEPHPISGTMLVFGPRDAAELEVVWRLVRASYNWATATKDDPTPPARSEDNGLARRVRSGRSGLFWDTVEGRAPLPRAAATLGFELIAADVEHGTIEVAFAATEDFTTPLGEILGGFLAAMLYDTVGPALLATLEPGQFISTLDLKASFLRPAFPGRLVGRGRVVHRDGDIAFLEGVLTNPDEAVVATAAATARVIAIDLSAS
jgi:uncharacterized protein (TIGR00369 family)